MPTLTAFPAKPYRTTSRATLGLWTAPAPAPPPPSQVVAAVLAFGDVQTPREDGAVTIRFSAARLEREDMQLLLGEDRARALQVAVVWDEAEAQMVQVLDSAPSQPLAELDYLANRYAAAKMRGPGRAGPPAKRPAAA